MKAYVTKMGVVSSIGLDAQSNFDALVKGRTGISPSEAEGGRMTAQVNCSDSDLKDILQLTSKMQVPRTALLGMLAAKETYGDTVAHSSLKTGFINGTTTGGMDLTEQAFLSKYSNSNYQLVTTHDLGTVTHLISNYLGIRGYINTISTACSSGSNAIMMGARMIALGMMDRVLVGGCDALTQFTINGFRSLMIYDGNLCAPFDENRAGLNLGEGAGYILLENEKSLSISQNNILAEIKGWANANDAYHQTGTSPDGLGAKIAMEKALQKANLQVSDIDYLSAHGTGTKNNDDSEAAAINALFDGVDFSSTKGFTGHTLGASGGIEAVYALLSMVNSHVFENLNCKNPMKDSINTPILLGREKRVTHTMSNSFGFGGNCTSLIFSKK